MTSDPVRAIRRRNVLLVAAVLAYSFGVNEGLPLVPPVTSFRGFLVTGYIVAGAAYAAAGIREFGYLFLREPVWPWYARRGAWFFLLPAMYLVNWLVMAVLSIEPNGKRLLPYPGPVFLWLIVALELAWIALLDWPFTGHGRTARPPTRFRRWPTPGSLLSRNHLPEAPPSDPPDQPLESWEYPPLFMDRSDSEESETSNFRKER